MSNVLEFLWWFFYVIFAIILQKLIPGVDTLVPALLITLQSKKISLACAFFIIFSFIQEGGGNLLFGNSFLWYGGVIAIFMLSSMLFMVQSIPSILAISMTIGLYHSLLLWFISEIQNIQINYLSYIKLGILQGVITAIMWIIIRYAQPKRKRNVN